MRTHQRLTLPVLLVAVAVTSGSDLRVAAESSAQHAYTLPYALAALESQNTTAPSSAAASGK